MVIFENEDSWTVFFFCSSIPMGQRPFGKIPRLAGTVSIAISRSLRIPSLPRRRVPCRDSFFFSFIFPYGFDNHGAEEVRWVVKRCIHGSGVYTHICTDVVVVGLAHIFQSTTCFCVLFFRSSQPPSSRRYGERRVGYGPTATACADHREAGHAVV